MRKPTFHAIACLGQNGAIGYHGKLLYRDPLDMMWFYNITIGHTVVMGRKTYDSLRGPLPYRKNIVLSRSMDYTQDDIIISPSIEHLLTIAPDDTYVIGGAKVYEELLPYCQYLHLTHIVERSGVVPDADAYFPDIHDEDWRVCGVSNVTAEDMPYSMKFETLRRKD